LIASICIVNNVAKSNPVIKRTIVPKDSVGLYEKFEMGINLTASFQNPFDPDDIDITTIFNSPSGKHWKINGFYNPGYWSSLWMVRFSPNEKGLWTYQVTVKDKEGEITGKLDTFISVVSSFHGPVHIAANNRYLEYADGTQYYGIGFWYNDGYQKFNAGSIKPEKIDELKALGVNFISSFIMPLETMGSGLGRYDQNLCGRLDEVLELCEQKNINLSLNLWFHAFLSDTVWPGGNRRWNVNPYNLICNSREFYSSKKAWSYQEKLYRYMIARWGYSRSLALWYVIDEVNGTNGWAEGDSLGAAKWAKQVQDYFKANDPYGHLTTGTRSGGVNEFWNEGYQTFDLPAREIYEAQGFPIIKDGKLDVKNVHPLTLSYLNYSREIKRLWNGYKKPAIIGETGWDHTFYEPGMPGYHAQYHNVLWVSLTSGTAMTPFWWAYSPYLNDNIVTNQLKSFEKFVSTIPFNKLSNIKQADATISDGDAFAISSNELTFGWAVNPKTDVTGAEVTVKSLPDGKYKLKIYHTWRGQFIGESQIVCKNGLATFTLPVLKIEGEHSRYIGQDAAFILIPVK
jgi:hypothetical protein